MVISSSLFLPLIMCMQHAIYGRVISNFMGYVNIY